MKKILFFLSLTLHPLAFSSTYAVNIKIDQTIIEEVQNSPRYQWFLAIQKIFAIAEEISIEMKTNYHTTLGNYIKKPQPTFSKLVNRLQFSIKPFRSATRSPWGPFYSELTSIANIELDAMLHSFPCSILTPWGEISFFDGNCYGSENAFYKAVQLFFEHIDLTLIGNTNEIEMYLGDYYYETQSNSLRKLTIKEYEAAKGSNRIIIFTSMKPYKYNVLYAIESIAGISLSNDDSLVDQKNKKDLMDEWNLFFAVYQSTHKKSYCTIL